MERSLLFGFGSQVAAALAAGVVGGVLTLLVVRTNPVVEPDVEPAIEPASVTIRDRHSDVDPDQMESLQRGLQAARDERSQLADALRDAHQRLDDLEGQLRAASLADQLAPAAADEPGPPQSDGTTENDVSGESGEQPDRRRRQRDAMLAVGLADSQIQDIESRQDRYSLARLELIDRASREGWRDSEQFDSELEALSAFEVDLREELGEAAYDQYLYERGTPNRVTIGSVIGGSAAFSAGLQNGDVVLSYANQRIFRMPELQAATRDGARGEYVQLAIMREGEYLTVDVPRGPLGVTLSRQRTAPEP